MNILITNFYTRDNNGDAAILSVLIQELNRVFKNPKISISSMENINVYKTFDDKQIIESFVSIASTLKYGRIIRFIITLYTITFSIIWAFIYRLFKYNLRFILNKRLQILLKHFIDSDIVILVGGGYIKGNKKMLDNISFITLIMPIIISVILKKRTILHSQSIGPFENKFQKLIIKYILNKTDLIVVRENISYNLLAKLGIQKKKLVQSVDAGFLFNTNTQISLEKLGIKKFERPLVGITVAKKWFDEPYRQEKYELEMANFCDYLIHKKKYNIIFIPQVTSSILNDDDRLTAINIIKKMHEKENIINIDKRLTHHEVKALYRNLDFLIGIRFHSVIFSLTNNIPSIAIEYEHKTRGIMQDLDLDKWVIKLEELNSKILISKFEYLILERDEYISSLKNKLPSYINEGKIIAIMIRDIYTNI